MDDETPVADDTGQLVVVGASAGGIEALLTLVSTLPADFPAPIVIAQHLDPQRQSQLGALLAGRSLLPVRTVTDHERLVPGTVYVVPADLDVEVSDHHVAVLPHADRKPTPSVDRLLATAARTFHDSLIAVVLTGTGSDGASGAQAVKAYGGTVIVQNPETARFPGMPQSVPVGAVDVVVDLPAIGPLLVDLLSGAYVPSGLADSDSLRPFLERIRERTGLDFTAYKRPTISRRLQRRMAAVGVDELESYRRYVDRNPEELNQLVAHFLIKVTEFFRDPELFAALRERVLPALIAEARNRGELRIWSAGCATGEEAYSVAMLVADLLGDDLESLPVRIFATDVSPDAVEFARRGLYPATAVAALPKEVVDRHFVRVDSGYEVRKAIRSLIIFGEHDLARRAPFPRIDLVLCRNVLIYFTTDLQRRALQLFAFSLRLGGYLVLGKSETVGPFPEFFTLEQPRLKLFRRVGEAMAMPAHQMMDALPMSPIARAGRRPLLRPQAALATQSSQLTANVQRLDRIMEEIDVGVAAVNRQYDVLSINAAARRLLGIHTVAIGEDIVHRVAAALREPLRLALDAALAGEKSTFTQHLARDVVDGEERDLTVTCMPIRMGGPEGVIGSALVEVVPVTPYVSRLRELEAEREQLNAAVAEVRTLRAANQTLAGEQNRLRTEVEILQVANEEAQAAAEEIETLNEEQQATNEELETVNEELQATIEELQATIGELQAANQELEALSAAHAAEDAARRDAEGDDGTP